MSEWDRNVTKRKEKKSENSSQETYDFKLFERQRLRLDNEILKRCELLGKMIEKSVSYSTVKNEISGLDKAFSELIFVCEKLRPLVTDKRELDTWLASVDAETFLI